MGQRIEARRTEITFEDMKGAMSRAWKQTFGNEPSVDSLCVLLAQSALETGQWRACYCYNLGNVKAGKSWTGDYCFYYADEIVDSVTAQKWFDLRAPRTDGQAGDNIVLKQLPNGKVRTTLYPDHPACRFRTFTNLNAAVEHHIEFLRGRYAEALPFAEAGDPAGFVRVLREKGYFTAPLDPYIRSVTSLFEKFKQQISPPPPPQSSEFTPELRGEDSGLFEKIKINDALKNRLDDAAETMNKHRPRYESISAAVGIPWYVIGVLHLIECNFDFDRALVSNLQAHREEESLSLFEQTAAEALRTLGFLDWSDYSVEGTLYRLEMHGGFEYRWYHPEVKSPFLWAGTNQYTKGRYIDGKFDANAVVEQIGAATILFVMQEKGFLWSEDTISFAEGDVPPKYPGRVIQRGERDREIVRLIQNQLHLAADGIFESDMEAAVKEFQSQNEDSLGRNLTADGKIGALTWEALFADAPVATSEPSDVTDPLLAKALLIAESQIGVMEEGGDNRGKTVEMYLRSIGLGPGFSWCAAFIYWCFERAAAELNDRNPLVRTGVCLVHWETAKKQGVRVITQGQARNDPSSVQPGHIFIIDHGSRKGHTGIVRRVEGGKFYTIEGNTNKAGSREGNCVFNKVRTIEEINMGFINYARPSKQIAAPVEITPPRVEVARTLTEVTELVPTKLAGGLLRAAVEGDNFEEPTWVEVPFQGYRVFVGADALRAQLGGKLRRLPVSYEDVIAICTKQNWVPPTSALSDAIYRAAAVKLEPNPQGKWGTPALDAETSRKMMTLEFVVSHNDAIDRLILAEKQGKLVSTVGKDWILSPRNILKAREAPTLPAATTYGWHQKNGVPIQGLGNDFAPPQHSTGHFDYSQIMRPIQRWAIRVSDGMPVDLLKVLCAKMPAAVMAPFPADAKDDELRTTHEDADDVAA